MIEFEARQESSIVMASLRRCKQLARAIKTQRAPSWPTPLSNDLPPKPVADELVSCYIRTTERVYRVLHLPSFEQDYDAFWKSSSEPDPAFLVQLKLVLAIGAATYDEPFSMRSSAVKWVYEGHTWLDKPDFKSRLNMQTVQIYILLMLAREAACISEDLMWISAGSLIRFGMQIGLHRDPSRLPKRPTLAAEMRRRIWNTILEIALQSSMNNGGPPLISLHDFDTEPPANFDDEQLMTDVCGENDAYTQTSTAIALRETFAARLAIVKFLNDLTTDGSYEETLRLDNDLRAAKKTLQQTLRKYQSGSDPAITQFELSTTEIIMQRYITALHIPFFTVSLTDTTFAFSRRTILDASLKMWSSAYASSSVGRVHSIAPGRNDLPRFIVCASGFLRCAVAAAIFLIALEVRAQVLDEESYGPVLVRLDLLAVLEESKQWLLQCIYAGETNVKGYACMCMILAQINGLRRGVGKEELICLLVESAKASQEMCLSLLEDTAKKQSLSVAENRSEDMLSSEFDQMQEWEDMVSKSSRV